MADVGTWMAGFDSNEDVRLASGIVGHHVNRAEDDPNLLTVYVAVTDLDKAKALAQSADPKDTTEKIGVAGPPEFMWMTPVREAVVWDRELPAMLASHRVADFDRWLQGYDAVNELRTPRGIIGHAANRSMDDPSPALVYHQAESFDTLRAFMADPALKSVKEQAGVTSEPEVSFHAGGWQALRRVEPSGPKHRDEVSLNVAGSLNPGERAESATDARRGRGAKASTFAPSKIAPSPATARARTR